MAKRKRAAAKPKARAKARSHALQIAPAAAPVADDPAQDHSDDDQIAVSGLPLHELFAQQALKMLDRADLDEEAKQSILVAMNCPCCGSGGLSFTAKLKRRS